MSITDKLLAIGENQLKVYDAGKLAVLKDSRYMNASVRGTVVSANDVSPVEHKMTVQLSSDTLTDFSDVTVKRCGKNLLDLSQFSFLSCRHSGDGTITANINDKVRCRMETKAAVNFLMANRGKLFTFSIRTDTEIKTRLTVVIYGTRTDGKSYQETRGTIGKNCVTFTVDPAFTKITLLDLRMLEKDTPHTDTSTVISELQLECGDTATAYEPYIEPTVYTAQADGTVDGVCSLSPNMTLATDTENTTISCAYLRDIDRYIDTLTGGD